ncbi:hypothetical protein HMPREF1318_0249 [Actinomyces massiliensis F0489]|uniref:Uncharacterized protein n=1 Tax=Actinomyces massiliensis F0489 TaxID=1125718 RepID=J0NI28_9ACTO|nr:hypothetical protein HMPREF1318_0249 [Actinomyces massiliensis F0489]
MIVSLSVVGARTGPIRLGPAEPARIDSIRLNASVLDSGPARRSRWL